MKALLVIMSQRKLGYSGTDLPADINMVKSWLKALAITEYELCYADSEYGKKLIKSYEGPIVTFGHQARNASVRMGAKPIYLPFPVSTNPDAQGMFIQRAIHVARRQLAARDNVVTKRIKVVRS